MHATMHPLCLHMQPAACIPKPMAGGPKDGGWSLVTLLCPVLRGCALQMYEYRAEAIAREKASQQGFRVTLEA
jgi:hypothetical protein